MTCKQGYLGQWLFVEAMLEGHCLLGQVREWHLLLPAEPA